MRRVRRIPGAAAISRPAWRNCSRRESPGRLPTMPCRCMVATALPSNFRSRASCAMRASSIFLKAPPKSRRRSLPGGCSTARTNVPFGNKSDFGTFDLEQGAGFSSGLAYIFTFGGRSMPELLIKHGEWVVVCDGAKALILENAGDIKFPNLKTVQVFEQEDLPTHLLGADKPGRTHRSVGYGSSAVTQTDWHNQSEQAFLTKIAQHLDAAV